MHSLITLCGVTGLGRIDFFCSVVLSMRHHVKACLTRTSNSNGLGQEETEIEALEASLSECQLNAQTRLGFLNLRLVVFLSLDDMQTLVLRGFLELPPKRLDSRP